MPRHRPDGRGTRAHLLAATISADGSTLGIVDGARSATRALRAGPWNGPLRFVRHWNRKDADSLRLTPDGRLIAWTRSRTETYPFTFAGWTTISGPPAVGACDGERVEFLPRAPAIVCLFTSLSGDVCEVEPGEEPHLTVARPDGAVEIVVAGGFAEGVIMSDDARVALVEARDCTTSGDPRFQTVLARLP